MNVPQRSLALLLSLAIAGAPLAQAIAVPVATSLPAAIISDNRAAAGTLENGVLTLRLEPKWTRWTLHSTRSRDLPMLAFAEPGGAATVPGPVLRVRAGTRVRVSVHNPLPGIELVVNGLNDHADTASTPLVVPSGTTGTREFIATAVGTYFYWATITGATMLDRRFGYDSQLNGAFVVDPPAPAPVIQDRIFLMSLWSDSARADGRFLNTREFWAINGRAWPETERLDATVGDSLHWRVINATGDTHPMHLHGFYFRVDAVGALGRDSVYAPAARRMAVTERLLGGMTMQIVWSPDRPGGWVFHCHMTVHLEPQPRLIGQGDAHGAHDPTHHVEEGMSGLIMAIEVRPSPRATAGGEPSASRAPRVLRLFLHSDSVTADSGGRRFTAVLQRGPQAPAPDSMPLFGSALVLERGEPTRIMVVNRTNEPSAIHWHGLELESYFDGVVGLGGMPGRRTPPIMPADSFEVRITPPRAGTFMYHTHLDDVRQQAGGLYGSFIVVEPGERLDPRRDFALMIANNVRGNVLINGTRRPDTLRVPAGGPVRLRIANITVSNPGLVMSLTRRGEVAQWRRVATDGFPLDGDRPLERAISPISNGEIRDVEFMPDAAEDLLFEVRSSAGVLLVSQVIRASEGGR